MANSNHAFGFIKVFRSVMDKAWYRKQDYFHLWAHLLLKANHSGKDVYFGGKLVKLNAGQFITGRLKLSQETGIEKSKIERILTVFKSEQQIEQRTDRQNRIITILSWNEYQSSEQRNEQRMNNERTTDEQRMNTDNKEKNTKKEKKKDILPSIADEEKSSAYPRCMELYSNFIIARTTLTAKISGIDGKALKKIISYLQKNSKEKTDDGVVLAFGYILSHYDKWDVFHQKQLKLNQIESNLINIINSIKNGKGKSTEQSGIIADLKESGML